jgi:hypothetical protein
MSNTTAQPTADEFLTAYNRHANSIASHDLTVDPQSDFGIEAHVDTWKAMRSAIDETVFRRSEYEGGMAHVLLHLTERELGL